MFGNIEESPADSLNVTVGVSDSPSVDDSAAAAVDNAFVQPGSAITTPVHESSSLRGSSSGWSSTSALQIGLATACVSAFAVVVLVALVRRRRSVGMKVAAVGTASVVQCAGGDAGTPANEASPQVDDGTTGCQHSALVDGGYILNPQLPGATTYV